MTLIETLMQPDLSRPAPFHGGRLKEAAKNSAIPITEWIDLSTGINPEGWQAPIMPPSAFSRLPEHQNELSQAAKDYYFDSHQRPSDSQEIVVVPGSQWLIQNLPRLVLENVKGTQTLSVLVPDIGYREHRYWWQYYGHATEGYSEQETEELLGKSLNTDVIVIINPNNPSTRQVNSAEILASARRNTGTLYLVDEAFMDTQPENSLLRETLTPNIMVLRSLGKFFGLAGLRVGFCVCDARIGANLKSLLGPWPIATASEHLATLALQDRQWQQSASKALKTLSGEFYERLISFFQDARQWQPLAIRKTDFFITLEYEVSQQAESLDAAMKQRGVLIRRIEDTGLVRIGLPELSRLEDLMNRLHAAHESHQKTKMNIPR